MPRSKLQGISDMKCKGQRGSDVSGEMVAQHCISGKHSIAFQENGTRENLRQGKEKGQSRWKGLEEERGALQVVGHLACLSPPRPPQPSLSMPVFPPPSQPHTMPHPLHVPVTLASCLE